MKGSLPNLFGRSGILMAVILAAIAYWTYSPPRGFRNGSGPASAPSVVSGSLRIDGPYFSDHDRIAERVIGAINRTRSSLDIAVYSITQPEIVAALEAAFQRGVQIRVVSDEQQARDIHSEISFLRSRGIAVRLSRGFKGQRSLMHNKFAVFDLQSVETGSFNWTTSASSYNYENAIIISDPQIAARYEEEFRHLWAQAY